MLRFMEARPSHYQSRYRHDLSPQQERVLRLIAAGKTNAEIADDLNLSLDGAKWHVREILAKLGVDSREEAAAWWREYQRPGMRIRRRISGLAGISAWKAAVATVGTAAVSTFAIVAGMSVRGGLGLADTDDVPPACTAENMRWETSTERVGDSTRLTLSIGLRDPDWYEGIIRALRISDRKVDSPCRLATDASAEMGEMIPLPGWPPEHGPAPLVPQGELEGIAGNPGVVALDTSLKLGPATPVLTVELSNWCGPQPNIGANIMIPAVRTGGPPVTHQGLGAELPNRPPCTDPSAPAQLTVSAVP